MTAVQLTLPWPPKELSPNSRGHWSKLAKANADDYARFGKVIKELGIQAD